MDSRSRAGSPPVPAVESHVAKILASGPFAGSARSCDLLRFTISKALAGQSAMLKETVLGVEVFGRKPDFDPQANSVVRVEFARLRKKLQAYYASEGRGESIRITYAKGSYVPELRWREEGPARMVWKSSLAVLPLAHHGSDPEDEYFADGLTEELITALSRVAGLRVVARTSSFAFKGRTEDVRDIGRVLQVDAVLEGSFRRQKDMLRIHARLITVSDGCQIWAEKYERKLTDVFEIQDEITAAIVDALAVELPRVQSSGRPARTRDLAAHELYLKGRFWWHRSSPEGHHRAAALFRESIARDPAYALPHSGLADATTLLAFYGYGRPRDVMPEAEAAARKALELDSNLVDAHCSLALIENTWNWDSDGCQAEFRRCFEINPGYALAYAKYGTTYLNPLRRYEESYGYIARALELDPLSPNNYADLALNFAYRRLFDRFDLEAAKVLEMNPAISKLHWFVVAAAGIRGNWAAAVKAAEDAARAGCDDVYTMAQSAWAHAGAGYAERAEQIRHCLSDLAKTRYVPAIALATAELEFGDEDRYFALLERGLEERDLLLRYLWQWHPLQHQPLYTNARFSGILRQAGI